MNSSTEAFLAGTYSAPDYRSKGRLSAGIAVIPRTLGYAGLTTEIIHGEPTVFEGYSLEVSNKSREHIARIDFRLMPTSDGDSMLNVQRILCDPHMTFTDNAQRAMFGLLESDANIWTQQGTLKYMDYVYIGALILQPRAKILELIYGHQQNVIFEHIPTNVTSWNLRSATKDDIRAYEQSKSSMSPFHPISMAS